MQRSGPLPEALFGGTRPCLFLPTLLVHRTVRTDTLTSVTKNKTLGEIIAKPLSTGFQQRRKGENNIQEAVVG